MANPLPGQITTFKEAVQWFLQQPDYAMPRTKVLAELYQATNDLFPSQEEFSGAIDVSGGVCQGMALTWIKKNNSVGGAEEFRDKAATNWETFAGAQVSINHKKRCLKMNKAQLRQETEEYLARDAALKSDLAYAQQTGILASMKHSVTPPKSSAEIGNTIQSLLATKTDLDQRRALLNQDIENMYPSMIFDNANLANRFENLPGNATLAQVGTKILADSGKHPAYYMVNMHETSGHCIAIHAAYRPRLMDANGCEIQFDGMPTLINFLEDYWQIYRRAGFASANADIYRFDLRISKGNLVSEYVERLNRGAVLAELPRH